jgi:hypothetical protein
VEKEIYGGVPIVSVSGSLLSGSLPFCAWPAMVVEALWHPVALGACLVTYSLRPKL